MDTDLGLLIGVQGGLALVCGPGGVCALSCVGVHIPLFHVLQKSVFC